LKSQYFLFCRAQYYFIGVCVANMNFGASNSIANVNL
jgi:hypothetical protein